MHPTAPSPRPRSSPSPLPAALFAAAAAAAVLVAASCATGGVNQGDVNLVSVEEEWRLGQQLERDLAGELRLVDDRAALGYVRAVGQRIVRQTELADLPWEFHVVADPEVNAFNIPGGHVYVHTGLLTAADNAAELAAVMSHEIAHGVSRHGTEQLTRGYGLNLAAGLLLGEDPAAYQQVLAQLAGAGTVARFSRGAETEADDLGLAYMQRAGYDPRGMVTMFEELLSRRRRDPGAVDRFFATHPLTEDRIDRIRRRIREQPSGGGLRMTESGFSAAKRAAARYG
jgi:predicted Zn-dependent protease